MLKFAKYRCEYCEGTVQPLTVKREAFKHKDGFVILENVTIGVCDNCDNRYYSAEIMIGVWFIVLTRQMYAKLAFSINSRTGNSRQSTSASRLDENQYGALVARCPYF